MKVTWTKWTCFLVAVIAIGTTCHLTASRYLVNFENLWPAMWSRYQMRNFDLMKLIETWGQQEQEPSWDEAVVMGSLDYTYGPWPLFGLVPEKEQRRLDPDNPQTQDPETIMGLALLGPEQTPKIRSLDTISEIMGRFSGEPQTWFVRLSTVAMRKARHTCFHFWWQSLGSRCRGGHYRDD